MARKTERKGLGRGLSALLAETDVSPMGDAVAGARPEHTVPIERIHPNPDQPRRTFVEADLEELAQSISSKGIIQPLVVRPDPTVKDGYQIVAGERRWRAAQRAQVHELPVVVRNLNDDEVLELAIIENVQRADLNPVEEASGYRQLMDRFGHTQERLASDLGKSRSYIANLLRLLTLPDVVLAYLRDGKLSVGHARALITANDPAALAKTVLDRGLSVRQTETLAKTVPKKIYSNQKVKTKDPDTRAIEAELSATLRMQVRVEHATGQEGGKITIRYKSLDQFDDLLRKLAE